MAHQAAADADPEAPSLTARDPLLRLACAVLASELTALQRQLPGDGSAPGPTAIHQMRIAIRRIRVALRLFSDFMPDETRHFRAEFRSVGRALGELRDLDVYRQSLAAPDESRSAAAALLQARIASARASAGTRLAGQLTAPSFTGLMAAFEDFLQRELTPATWRRWQSLRIGTAARADLGRSLRRVLVLGRKIDAESPPQQLHRLRIRAKRLRYESEFYAPFHPAADRLARSAKALQDSLGTYRDACHAAELLNSDRKALGLASSDPRAAAIDALIDAQRARAVAARREFAVVWRRFEKRACKSSFGRKRG